jgi:hypothetical protein
MKPDRVENLVSWMWTGAILFGAGLFFVVFGWFLPTAGMKPLTYRGGVADPKAALVIGSLAATAGLLIVGATVIARLRGGR